MNIHFKKTAILLLAATFLATSFSPARAQAAARVQPTEDNIVIVIDPGHGGENEGTIENGFLEKSMNLITAQAMYDELSLYDGVTLYMTHTEDVDMSLAERAQFAADVNADFLFSIHYNASVKHDLFGSETWISSQTPFNAYGYQFGYVQMETMRDMGLFLRGVKTKINDKGTDYYGIIRESAKRSLPAVIIEHCHVDEIRDYPFCDTEEEQKAFGRADALSVAKYFGLKSEALGVDYSEYAMLPDAQKDSLVLSTLADETEPDVCLAEVVNADYETGQVQLQVTAADYDSPLIYYSYSYDGGTTFSPLQMWPGSDTLNGTYTDTFLFTLEIPSGVRPDIQIRAYNMFDLFAESEHITTLEMFRYGEEETTPEEAVNEEETEEKTTPGTTTFLPTGSDKITEGMGQIGFLTFLIVCLILVVVLFIILLMARALRYGSRSRKKQGHRRNEDGDRRNQRR